MGGIYTVRRVGNVDDEGKYLVWVEELNGPAMFNYRFIRHLRVRVKTGFGAFLERHNL